MKTIVFKNSDGVTFTSSYDTEINGSYEFAPTVPVDLVLGGIDGICASDISVFTQKNNEVDGEMYQNSTLNKREIHVYFELFCNFHDYRDFVFYFFRPRCSGTITITEDGKNPRVATYYPEKIDIEESGAVREAIVTLICPDPLFYAESDVSFNAVQLKDFKNGVINPSTIDVGLTIEFKATGSVSTPEFVELSGETGETVEWMMYNDALKAGDVLSICTIKGKKYVKLNGVNVINKMKFPVYWIMARPGINGYIYTTGSGADNLSCTVKFTPAYLGA